VLGCAAEQKSVANANATGLAHTSVCDVDQLLGNRQAAPSLLALWRHPYCSAVVPAIRHCAAQDTSL
jgi:hypothetical protein